MATTFQYQVRDKSGRVQSGTIEADSASAVATKLKSLGYATISITERPSGGLHRDISLPHLGPKVKLKDLAVFSRQFATMINSGLSLLGSLSILEQQTQSKELARSLMAVRLDVESGAALSMAMGRHPDIFPPLMINMIKAGEVGGFLDEVMLQIATNYEAESKLRSKVKSAMTYPVAVLVIAILAVIGMLLFIVPTFVDMFASLGGELPLPTQVLVSMSTIVRTGFPVLFVLAVAGFVTWNRIKTKPRTRDIVDPLKLRLPVFGPLFQKIALARFTRNLGTMIHSGVPILQALDIVADTSGNVVVARAVRDVRDSVRTGESLTKPLSNHPVFPPMVVQMMAVGEDTGALDEMLHKISQFYDQEVESTTEALTSLIEPIMIVVLGGLVGSMIIALYMPIFKVFDLIKG